MSTDYILDRPGTTDEMRKLRAELVGRARELVPLLAQNADKTEQGRRLTEETVSALEDAGLFKVTRPRRFGGYESDIRTLVDVTREVARGDGSAAWVLGILNGGNVFMGGFNKQAQDDVWGADPEARIAISGTPAGEAVAVEGGYRITGRWAWASGVHQAQWSGVGVPVPPKAEGDPPNAGLFLIPLSEASIDDTWHVVGMRGTGSNTVVAEDLFVPDHHIAWPLLQLQGIFDTEFEDEPLYRSTLSGFAALSIAGPLLGMAQAALELVLEKAPKRSITYSGYQTQVEAPSVQFAVAEAAMHLDTAHLLVHRAAADVDQAAYDGLAAGYHVKARTRATVTQAIAHCRQAIGLLVTAHGASTFAEINPLQRIWRDAETASRHGLFNDGIAKEVFGQSLMGIEDPTAFL